jgi:hypothetical protein
MTEQEQQNIAMQQDTDCLHYGPITGRCGFFNIWAHHCDNCAGYINNQMIGEKDG